MDIVEYRKIVFLDYHLSTKIFCLQGFLTWFNLKIFLLSEVLKAELVKKKKKEREQKKGKEKKTNGKHMKVT